MIDLMLDKNKLFLLRLNKGLSDQNFFLLPLHLFMNEVLSGGSITREVVPCVKAFCTVSSSTSRFLNKRSRSLQHSLRGEVCRLYIILALKSVFFFSFFCRIFCQFVGIFFVDKTERKKRVRNLSKSRVRHSSQRQSVLRVFIFVWSTCITTSFSLFFF